jgi:hypothetical protein
MQTFLPVKSFVRSAEILDVKRLGKQRIEAAQILECLTQQPILPTSLQSLVPFNYSQSPWKRHPAVLMWKTHEEWLKLYLACILGEWVSRGYENNIQPLKYNPTPENKPPWLGYEPFHRSHRSNLIRKFPGYYHRLWPNESPDLIYFWPSHHNLKEIIDDVKNKGN